MPYDKWKLLDAIFDNLEIRAAEDHICNFQHDYQVYFDNMQEGKMEKIAQHIRMVLQEPDFKFPKNDLGISYIPQDIYQELDLIRY